MNNGIKLMNQLSDFRRFICRYSKDADFELRSARHSLRATWGMGRSRRLPLSGVLHGVVSQHGFDGKSDIQISEAGKVFPV